MVHTGSLHHRKENTEGIKWGRKRKAHEEEEIIAEKREKMNKDQADQVCFKKLPTYKTTKSFNDSGRLSPKRKFSLSKRPIVLIKRIFTR
jgi:hypothetical protein